MSCSAAGVEEVNLSVYQGDTGVYSFVITSKGQPVDLVDATFLMQIRESWADDSSVSAELSYVVDGNRVTFALHPTQSRRLRAGNHRWDVQMANKDKSVVVTFARGRFTVVPEVSRG